MPSEAPPGVMAAGVMAAGVSAADGLPAEPTRLPADRARPPVPSFIRRTVSVSRAEWSAVPEADDPVLRLTALLVLLGRWTLQDTVRIGLVTGGEEEAGLGGLSVDVVDAPVSRIAGALREALDDPKGLVEHGGGGVTYDDPGLSARGRGAAGPFDPSDIDVRVLDDAIEAEYDAEAFGEETVRDLLSYWAAALDDLSRHPDREAPRLRLMPDGALAGSGRTVASAPADTRPVHRLFEEQVRRRPDAIALTVPGVDPADGSSELTYAELDVRSNRLAGRLASAGVGRGDLVGLAVDDAADAVVGILGILKAGGAYVPFDAAQPAERIAFILSDAAVGRIVASRARLAGLPDGSAEVVPLEEPDAEPAPAPEVEIAPDDPAYVIYTSGSTGQPKGVLVTHGNVTRLFHATESVFGFGEDDVWTFFHSYAFDFSVWEMWGALIYGGRIVAPPRLLTRSPERFRQLVADQGVTVLNQTPSAFRQFDAADTACDPQELSLRWVIFGGEALEPSTLRGWFDRHGDREPALVNMYGITETTVHVTHRRMGRPDVRLGRSFIGRPLDDLEVHVLDEAGLPVPTGIPGEMFVTGGGVAQGYLNRPELTGERFVEVPGPDGSSVRAYRSGDLARRVRSGDGVELEYLGRADQQVKVRGFRIELGEVEAALRGHAGVTEAVADVRPDEEGHVRLMAWVVGSELPDEAGLRRHLARSLPSYMVPTAIVPVPALPLTANGKLDRARLPEPDATVTGGPRPTDSGQGLERDSESGLERDVAAVYEALLNRAPVGVEDNFFELGGDSVLVLRAVEALRERLEVEVDPVDVFQFPTVRLLAKHLAERSGTESGDGGAELTDEVGRRAARRREALTRRRRAHGRRQDG